MVKKKKKEEKGELEKLIERLMQDDKEGRVQSFHDMKKKLNTMEEQISNIKEETNVVPKNMEDIEERLGSIEKLVIKKEAEKKPKEKGLFEKAAKKLKAGENFLEKKEEEKKEEKKEMPKKEEKKEVKKEEKKNIEPQKKEENNTKKTQEQPQKEIKEEGKEEKKMPKKKKEEDEGDTVGAMVEAEIGPTPISSQSSGSSPISAPTASSGNIGSSVEIAKVIMEIEKVKALVDSIKGAREATDERIQTLSGNLGEVRSMVYQREASIKDIESKMQQFKDLVENLAPERYAKEMKKVAEELSNLSMRLDKTEKTVGDASKGMKDVKELLESIGNLDNISEVNKKVREERKKIDEKIKEVEKYSGRVERLFVDVNKRLEEFDVYKVKQNSLDESFKDLLKTFDNFNSVLGRYAQKDELTAVTESIKTVKKDFESKLTPQEAETKVKSPAMKELIEEKEEIELLINQLEEKFIKKKLSHKDYEKAKKANVRKMEYIQNKIDRLTKKTEKKMKKEVREELPEVQRKTKEERLVKELDALRDIGMISKEAYEKTIKVITKGSPEKLVTKSLMEESAAMEKEGEGKK